MVEFARNLGLTHAAVSKYEAGKLIPSRSILLLLLPLAEGDESGPILEALGAIPTDSHEWEAEMRVRMAAARKKMADEFGKTKDSRAARERFFDLAMEIVQSGRAPFPLIRAMELWRDNSGSAAARAAYADAMMALATDLDRIERGLAPVGKKPATKQPESIIGKVMMQCPTTKKWFDTGSRMRSRDFEVSDFGGLAVFCPHCQMSHPFDKMRATVQQEE